MVCFIAGQLKLWTMMMKKYHQCQLVFDICQIFNFKTESLQQKSRNYCRNGASASPCPFRKNHQLVEFRMRFCLNLMTPWMSSCKYLKEPEASDSDQISDVIGVINGYQMWRRMGAVSAYRAQREASVSTAGSEPVIKLFCSQCYFAKKPFSICMIDGYRSMGGNQWSRMTVIIKLKRDIIKENQRAQAIM